MDGYKDGVPNLPASTATSLNPFVYKIEPTDASNLPIFDFDQKKSLLIWVKYSIWHATIPFD